MDVCDTPSYTLCHDGTMSGDSSRTRFAPEHDHSTEDRGHTIVSLAPGRPRKLCAWYSTFTSMYRVLLGIDTDEQRALAQAEAVTALPAAEDAVEALVMHVFQENPEGASVGQIGAVRRVVELFEAAGVDHELLEASGDPAAELIDAAERHDVDTICVAGRQQTPAGKVIFGSTTQSVILGTDRPVLAASAGD